MLNLGPLRDLQLALAIPLVPIYYVFLKAASLVAILDETFLRKSHQDNFLPKKVRRVTLVAGGHRRPLSARLFPGLTAATFCPPELL